MIFSGQTSGGNHMDDLTFGVAIKGTGDGSLVKDAQAATDELVNLKDAADMTAASYAKLNQQALASGQAWLQGNAAADAARDKAYALANGYKEVGGQILKTGKEAAEGMEQTAFATARAKQEMVVLGRELARGNFSRIPGTLSIIAQGLSPVALGVAAVTAAVAAGAYAWYEWGDSAGKATDKALDGLKAAQAAAAKSKHMDDVEKIAEINRQIFSLESKNKSDLETIDKESAEERTASNNKQLADHILFLSQTRMARQENIANLVQDAAKLQALLDKSAETRLKKEESAGQKLLAETKRLDDQMVMSHEDAFFKTIEAWKQMEDKSSAALAADVITRAQYIDIEKQQVHSYTVFVNAENEKRIADAAATAAKEKATHDKHLAIQLKSENAYFAQMQAAADNDVNTHASRERRRFEKDIIEFQKRYELAKLNHSLTLAEEKGFQDALDAIMKVHNANEIGAANQLVNIRKALRDGDFQDAMSKTMAMTAGIATHSRAAFEINKIASLAKATVSGYQMIQASATDGAEWGGYYGAIAEGALAAAFVVANIDAINSTQFGGGGGVSAPSGGGGGSSSPSYGAPNAGNNTPQPTPAPQQTQPVTVNIYNTGNLLSQDYIDNVVIAQIKDRIANADVTIIDPRSRQAQMLSQA
jgi:hypothetical protein